MIPHSRPTMGTAEEAAVLSVLRSGRLAAGERVRIFEQSFAAAVGMQDAVMVSSGTAGLHLALLALGVGPGDEVILPSYVCSALLHAVLHAGARPVLADSGEGHGHMDHRKAMERITPRTRAVIVAPLFGDTDDARAWRQTGLAIVEDGTQSLGALCQGAPVGSMGDVSVFSLYATKMITAGEGGVVAACDGETAQRLADLRAYDEKDNFRTRFNYKPSDMAAALAWEQLRRLPDFLQRRRALAASFDAVIGPAPRCRKANTADSVYYRYVLRCDDALRYAGYMASAGVQCKRPVHTPLHRLLGLPDAQFPWASYHHARNLSIPLYPSLSREEIQTICSALGQADHVEV